MTLLQSAFLVALALGVSLPLSAQLPTKVRIATGLSRVSAVRELPDGTVLFTDTQDRALFSVSAGRAPKQLGRQGDGPFEYRQPARLFALQGDTTLVVDGSNRRWLLLVGTRFIPLLDIAKPLASSLGTELESIDAYGRVLQLSGFAIARKNMPWRYPGQPAGADSIRVLRFRFGSEGVDSIRTIRGGYDGPSAQRTVTMRGSRMSHHVVNPLRASEWATSFPDGTIAIVYLTPYRVEVIEPNGRATMGPPIEAPVRVSAQIKRSVVALRWTDDDGSMKLSPSDFPYWSAYVPALEMVLTHPVLAAVDGRLYIHRRQIDQSPRRVDVINRTGKRVSQMQLPHGAAIVDSGKRGLYVVVTDPDGLQELWRYVYPL